MPLGTDIIHVVFLTFFPCPAFETPDVELICIFVDFCSTAEPSAFCDQLRKIQEILTTETKDEDEVRDVVKTKLGSNTIWSLNWVKSNLGLGYNLESKLGQV